MSKFFIFFVMSIGLFLSSFAEAKGKDNGCYDLADAGADEKTYLACVQKACDQGVVKACGTLGVMYANPEFDVFDKAKGFQLMEDACNKGSGDICYALANKYMGKRQGNKMVGGDFEKASLYSKKGCDFNFTFSCTFNILHYLITQDNITDVQHKRTYEISSKLCGIIPVGEVPVCRAYGSFYEKGILVPRDINKALSIYKQACDKEEALSCEILSILYKEGKLVNKDEKKATQYEKLAQKYFKIQNNQDKSKRNEIINRAMFY